MIRARFETPEQIFEGCPGTVILPLSALAKMCTGDGSLSPLCSGDGSPVTSHPALAGKTVIAEIPAIIWPSHTETVRQQLRTIKEAGITDVLAENLGAVALAKEDGFTIHGGMTLNILNTEALDVYRAMGLADVTLSFELAFAESRGLAAPDTGFVTYGYLPLMKFRNCPAQGRKGCAGCSGKNELVDRKGEHFPILCRERQYSELFNCVPLYVGDKRLPDVGFETLYFTMETKEECRAVYRRYVRREAPDFRRTAGLYFREVQ